MDNNRRPNFHSFLVILDVDYPHFDLVKLPTPLDQFFCEHVQDEATKLLRYQTCTFAALLFDEDARIPIKKALTTLRLSKF